MIDIKTLNEYSRFINLKQICDLAGVSYNNVQNKIQRFRLCGKVKLNETETINLSARLVSLGNSFQGLRRVT